MFIVVDPEKAKNFGVLSDALMNDENFRDTIYFDIKKLAQANNLNSLEKPKQIKLLKDPWTD